MSEIKRAVPKVGDSLFCFDRSFIPEDIIEVRVKKVGRKYFYVNRFQKHLDPDIKEIGKHAILCHQIERWQTGIVCNLFESRQDALDSLRREALATSIELKFSRHNLRNYPLATLEVIDKLLTNAEPETS